MNGSKMELVEENVYTKPTLMLFNIVIVQIIRWKWTNIKGFIREVTDLNAVSTGESNRLLKTQRVAANGVPLRWDYGHLRCGNGRPAKVTRSSVQGEPPSR